jgi:hypothetical protein
MRNVFGARSKSRPVDVHSGFRGVSVQYRRNRSTLGSMSWAEAACDTTKPQSTINVLFLRNDIFSPH